MKGSSWTREYIPYATSLHSSSYASTFNSVYCNIFHFFQNLYVPPYQNLWPILPTVSYSFMYLCLEMLLPLSQFSFVYSLCTMPIHCSIQRKCFFFFFLLQSISRLTQVRPISVQAFVLSTAHTTSWWLSVAAVFPTLLWTLWRQSYPSFYSYCQTQKLALKFLC